MTMPAATRLDAATQTPPTQRSAEALPPAARPAASPSAITTARDVLEPIHSAQAARAAALDAAAARAKPTLLAIAATTTRVVAAGAFTLAVGAAALGLIVQPWVGWLVVLSVLAVLLVDHAVNEKLQAQLREHEATCARAEEARATEVRLMRTLAGPADALALPGAKGALAVATQPPLA